jgi:hypothetical protein
LADFSINYATGKSAYIEDYYEIGGDPSDQHKITEKFNATLTHIDQARSTNPSQLYISFASGAGMRSLNETGTPEVRPERVLLLLHIILAETGWRRRFSLWERVLLLLV